MARWFQSALVPWSEAEFVKAYDEVAAEIGGPPYRPGIYAPHLESEYLGPPWWADGFRGLAGVLCEARQKEPWSFNRFVQLYEGTGDRRPYQPSAFTNELEVVYASPYFPNLEDLAISVRSMEHEFEKWGRTACVDRKEPWSLEAFKRDWLEEGKEQVFPNDLPYPDAARVTALLPRIYSNPRWRCPRQLAMIMQLEGAD